MSTETATKEIKVTVVTTKGEKKEFKFSGTTYGELKKILGNTYDLKNMKAIESIRKTTLESDQAILPTEDFHIFLMPYKSKSGAPKKKVAAKKTAKKPAKKVAAKKVTAKKKSTTVKKAKEVVDNGVADVVESVKKHKTDEELEKEFKEVAGQFSNVEQPRF